MKRKWTKMTGGKRRNGENAYNATILIRVYETDRAKIEAAAKKSGESMSGFVREAAIRAAKARLRQ